jgi:hypothetical protein
VQNDGNHLDLFPADVTAITARSKFIERFGGLFRLGNAARSLLSNTIGDQFKARIMRYTPFSEADSYTKWLNAFTTNRSLGTPVELSLSEALNDVSRANKARDQLRSVDEKALSAMGNAHAAGY